FPPTSPGFRQPPALSCTSFQPSLSGAFRTRRVRMPAHDGQICGPISGSGVNENQGVNENTRSLMMSQLVRASVLSLVCLAVTATTAPARGPYDGPWSVTIVTQRGGCQPSYRYGVEIVNGFVTYGGSGGVSMSGRVAPNGRVVVAVSAGSASA